MKSHRRIIAFLLLSGSLMAQTQIDARGLGLCGSYTVISRGISSVGYNPANLGYTEDVTLSVDFLNFNMSAYNNFMSLALFNQYFTGDVNGDPINLEARIPGSNMTHKEYLLSEIPDEGFTVGVGTNLLIPALNISMGNYAFSSGVDVFTRYTLPKSMFQIALDGNPVNSVLDLSVSQDMLVIANTAFSFAIPFEQYNVGFTFKYLAGIGFAGVDSSGGAFSTKPEGMMSDGFYRYSRAIGGNGLAVDVGLNTRRINDMQFGMAVNNLIGFINWGNDDNYISRSIGLIESFIPIRSMLDIPSDGSEFSARTIYRFEIDTTNAMGALDNTDSLFVMTNEDVAVPDSIQMNYPAIFRIGAAYYYKSDFILLVDLSTGLDEYYFASRNWRLSVATEWIRFKRFPIRSGMAFGGFYGVEASLGAGFRMLWIDGDIGLRFLGGMSFASAKGIEFGLSLKFKK